MIILDSIPAVVQKTLLEKMRMSGKRTTKVSEPMSKGDGKADGKASIMMYVEFHNFLG